MLENLVVAVESESQIVDLGRVSGFMQKVCSSTLLHSYLTSYIFRSEMASSDLLL
jgi:hypothetical protein